MSLVKAVLAGGKLLYFSRFGSRAVIIAAMLIGIECLLVFLVMAGLMYMRRLSTLLALPLMGLLIAALGGIPAPDILSNVLARGATKLNVAYTTTMFGAMLAELINKQGIAKAVVRWTAEFAGDNPFVLGLLLTAVTAVLFSTLGGLGAVIMVGTIVLPVMLSIGVSSLAAGCLLLFGISIGGMFNLGNWQLYIDLLGVSQSQISSFVVPLAGIMSALLLVFLGVELRKLSNVGYIATGFAVLAGIFAFFYKSGPAAAQAASPAIDATSVQVAGIAGVLLFLYALYRHRQNATSLPGIALLTPFLPLALVLLFHWDIIPAFVAGLIYGALATWQRNSVNTFTRALLDGVVSVAPAVVVMIGIGILYMAVTDDKLKQAMAPLLTHIVPTHALAYIIVFTLVAPLALYRGPLNVWGLGSGLAALIKKTSALSPQALFGMLMSVGQIQGICDPANTQNIWVATYLGIDTRTILARTIPYAWAGVVSGLLLAAGLGYVPW